MREQRNEVARARVRKMPTESTWKQHTTRGRRKRERGEPPKGEGWRRRLTLVNARDERRDGPNGGSGGVVAREESCGWASASMGFGAGTVFWLRTSAALALMSRESGICAGNSVHQ